MEIEHDDKAEDDGDDAGEFYSVEGGDAVGEISRDGLVEDDE